MICCPTECLMKIRYTPGRGRHTTRAAGRVQAGTAAHIRTQCGCTEATSLRRQRLQRIAAPDALGRHGAPSLCRYRAGVGSAVSALFHLWSLWTDRRRHLAVQRPPDTVDHGEADTKIRSFNQAKAERYLAERDRHKR